MIARPAADRSTALIALPTRFARRDHGNVALLFAVLAPLLIGVAGAAIDYGRYATFRISLQDAADAAAILGARQMSLSSAASVAENVASAAALERAADAGAQGATAVPAAHVAARSMTVRIAFEWTPTMLTTLYRNPLKVEASATAQLVSSGNICVLGLAPGPGEAVSSAGASRITGNGCGVFANATTANALAAAGSALITADIICSSGGYAGSPGNFSRTPLENCPQTPDPLLGRAEPTPGACDTGLTSNFGGSTSATATPGVYCAGLKVAESATVDFAPGEYFIVDSALTIQGGATVTGVDVSFFFAGDAASAAISGTANVSLSARETGPLAGMLFWRSASAVGQDVFSVSSPNVTKLVGTIYAPAGVFEADIPGGGAVAASSAYTAIVAGTIRTLGGANLVLNSDYASTAVPVPAGLSNGGEQIVLRN
ncbi:MAG: TadE/TadG family type IV pilus assembly protein [Parvularculaceae bacterium]